MKGKEKKEGKWKKGKERRLEGHLISHLPSISFLIFSPSSSPLILQMCPRCFELEQAHKAGKLMSCQIEDSTQASEAKRTDGLLYNHAYGILKLVTYHGHRLLLVHNPHGHGKWTGRWGDNTQV
jgi:Calpain family cysteine protease